MRIKQVTREAIAYIAVKHQSGNFSTGDIPKELRRGMPGVVQKEMVEKIGRTGHKDRIYSVTEKGIKYANRFASTEMESFQ